MARNDKRDRISYETLERKYHEARAEIHQLRAQLLSEARADETILPELEHLTESHKGYGRWGRSQNGHYWVRWKWTQDVLTGRYAIGGHSTLPLAILACLADVDLIVSGKKVAPLDVGYRK